MAKTRNMPTGADSNLISAASYGAKLSSGQAMGSGAAGVLQSAQGMQPDINYRKQLRKQAEATMGNFIDNMPANIDIAKVPQSMRPQLGKHLIEMKNEYFENAKLASSNSPNSPIYMEAVDKMNSITQSFANLNADFERLKEMKYQAIEDFDKGMISDGNKPEDIDFISKLTTDQIQFQIGPGGRLVYGEGATLDDVPKYHYKDHDTATKILDLSNTLYNAGAPMDKGREQIVRMQLQQQLKKGGRDAVLSMATDDHIIPGGLGIQDIDLLENPERQEELEQFVINSYMDVLRNSAQSGYDALLQKERRSDDRLIARNARIKANTAGSKSTPSVNGPGEQSSGTTSNGIPSYLAGTSFDIDPSTMTKEMIANHNTSIGYFNDAQREVRRIQELEPGTTVQEFIGNKYNGKEIRDFKIVSKSNKTLDDPFAKDSKFVEITVVDKTLTETPTTGPNRGQKSVIDVTSVVKLDLNNPVQNRMFVKNYLENIYGAGTKVDKAIQMTGDYNRGVNSLPTLQDALNAKTYNAPK